MPIKNQQVKLPRLGKVHLGKKVQKAGGVEHPQATDYFVVKADNSTPEAHAEAFKAVYGDKPNELDIMFASEDEEAFASQFLRYYSRGGLLCRGDGQEAVARIDRTTGAFVDSDSKPDDVFLAAVPCSDECPKRAEGRCRPVLCLQFILPSVDGLGVWQIDTSSFHSQRNLLSQIELIKGLLGRISLVPLKLRLVPLTVQPLGLPKKVVNVLQLQVEATLFELRRQTLALPMPQVAMAALDDAEEPGDLEAGAEAFFEKQEEEPFPEEEVAEAEAPPMGDTVADPGQGDGGPPAAPRRFANIGEVLTACLHEFAIRAPEACTVLRIRVPHEYRGDLAEAYTKIAEHARSKNG